MTDLARGSLVTFSDRGEYTGKPRPGLVVQRGSTLADAPSITLCGLTTAPVPANAARVSLMPSPDNRLHEISYVMVDKIVSISRARIRTIFGRLEGEEMEAVDTALRRWLDL